MEFGLLPCPFCGTEINNVNYHDGGCGTYVPTAWIECQNCTANVEQEDGCFFGTKEQETEHKENLIKRVVSIWNNRAPNA